LGAIIFNHGCRQDLSPPTRYADTEGEHLALTRRMVCRLVLKARAMAAMGMPGQQNEVSIQLKIANLNMTLARPVSVHVR
jgi:hypothetical protein